MGVCVCVCVCSAQYYVKVMKKVQEKGDEYIQTEQERLTRILSKSILSFHLL